MRFNLCSRSIDFSTNLNLFKRVKLKMWEKIKPKLRDLHLHIVCMWQSCPRQHLSPPQSTSTPNYGSLALYNCILKKCHGQDKLILSLKASHATPAILLLRASFIIIHWKISGTICGPDRYSLNPLMRIIASLNI